MLFDEKKLLPESIDELLRCPIATVKPYSLMLAPVYVFMKLNQKFVTVKAPLDFFTPDELEKLARYETFFLPLFVQASSRFQTAAHLTKNILTVSMSELGQTPFELSNEVFSVTAGLWGKEIKVEPFFMSIFADELCGALQAEEMIEAREKAVILHDEGLLLSGAYVFLSLHLGEFNFEKLRSTRQKIYLATIQQCEMPEISIQENEFIEDLRDLIDRGREFSIEALGCLETEWSRRLISRLSQIANRKLLSGESAASIYGPEGFVA